MLDKCKKCGSAKVVMIEYGYPHPERYDGVSEIKCLEKNCGARFGRWSGKELKAEESERRFGRKQPIN
jgi:hypothetical protein